MQEFLRDTTIHGVEFFDPRNKSVRPAAIIVFLVAFCGLGFFMVDIYLKWQVNPKLITEEVNLLPSSDFPFPAVTICDPIFSRDQKPNLYEVLRNPGKNLTVEEQRILAANVQASAPHLGGKFSKIYPNIDPSDTVKVLKEKFHHFNDSLEWCGYRNSEINCERLLNYVLTDYGFCFSYNLQGFNQLFNKQTISKNFLSYQRTKIAKTYGNAYSRFYSYETVDDDHDEVQWTLEGGYANDSFEIQPTRASKRNAFSVYPKLNHSDLSNLIPGKGRTFSIFLHLPNEILTPFHEPRYLLSDKMLVLNFKMQSYKTDENLRRYSPKNRGCYFADEKPLKFFKSYTKSQCEFECLSNKTLEKCKCVKFSMPRNYSTPICNLNQTSCYLSVSRKWSEKSPTCKCLPLCNFITYIGGNGRTGSEFQTSSVKHIFSNDDLKDVEDILEDQKVIWFNDKSSFFEVLGIFFGCSVLSLVEIFHFVAFKIFKHKINSEETLRESPEIATECTVHGFQFIFDPKRRPFVRIFWTMGFLISLGFCIKNAHENYVKLAIEPEVVQNLIRRPSREVPLPSITICSTIFAKNGLANNTRAMNEVSRKRLNISTDEIKYLFANQHRFAPYTVKSFEKSTNFSQPFDIVQYLNQSEFEIDELMFDCTLERKQVECSKLFRRVLTSYDAVLGGICFSFNQLNFHDIFNEEVSSDFDSYGRFLKENSHWTIDKGYQTLDEQAFPIRASEENEISVSLKVSEEDATNSFLSLRSFKVYIKKPNEVSHLSSKSFFLKFQDDKVLWLSAKTSTYNQEFRKFSPEKRGCYFTNERKLRFFKSYVEENCLRECVTNQTLKLCGCVHMSMPRNETTRICIFAKETWCYLEKIKKFPTKDLGNPPCGCLKTCNDIEYSVEKTTKNLDGGLKKILKQNYLITRVKFKFSESFIDEEEYVVGYGLKEFLTDLGGLLGLYLGCSTVSLVEVFYHPIKAVMKRFRNPLKNRKNQVQQFEREKENQDNQEEQKDEFAHKKFKAIIDSLDQIRKEEYPNGVSKNNSNIETNLERYFGTYQQHSVEQDALSSQFWFKIAMNPNVPQHLASPTAQFNEI